MTDTPKPDEQPTDATSTGGTDGTDQTDQTGAQTFTKDDVDRAVAAVVARERKRFADYDDLKAKAGEKATADERIADLERQIAETQREALRRRVQAAHQIADEDADLFLTGTDEETLTAQAKRLAERESERRKSGTHVPNEGRTPNPPKADDRKQMADDLWAQMS